MLTVNDSQVNIYASGNAGDNWESVAKFGMNFNHVGQIKDFFEWNGKIYISQTKPAGKTDNYATSVATLNGDFTEEEPVILHPVYWVSPSGIDAIGYGIGYRPSFPWKSLEFAMQEDRICKGARVIVAPGTYQVDNVRPDWDNPVRQGTGSVIIEGSGKDKTIIYNTASATDNYLFYAEPEEGATVYKDMKIYTTKVLPNEMNIIATLPGSNVEFRDCIIGDCDYKTSNLVSLAVNTSFKLKRSLLTGNVSIESRYDTDYDGVFNICDNCPSVANTNQADLDSDGFGDVCDNCPDNCNTEQLDADNDGIGDVCDADPGCGYCLKPACEQEC